MPWTDDCGRQQRTYIEEMSADLFAALNNYPAVLRAKGLTGAERRTLASVEKNLRVQLARVMPIENRLIEAQESAPDPSLRVTSAPGVGANNMCLACGGEPDADGWCACMRDEGEGRTNG